MSKPIVLPAEASKYPQSTNTKDFTLSAPAAGYTARPYWVIVACLKNANLFGEHAIENLRGISARKIGKHDFVQFDWRPAKGQLLVSTLPVSSLAIEIDESKSVPTIQFGFDINKIHKAFSPVSYDALRAVSPNRFISEDFLVEARIRLSSACLRKNPILFLKHTPMQIAGTLGFHSNLTLRSFPTEGFCIFLLS